MADLRRRTSEEDRDETPSERADRNFGEVVQELRVAQTGVQILFAFLLSLSFLSEFPDDDPVFDWVLAAALLTSAGAAVCFIAPVASHRLQFRRGRKETIVWIAHWMSIAGLALLIVAMTLAVWLVIAHLWTATAATLVALGMVAFVAVTWIVVPIWLSRVPGGQDRSPDHGPG